MFEALSSHQAAGTIITPTTFVVINIIQKKMFFLYFMQLNHCHTPFKSMSKCLYLYSFCQILYMLQQICNKFFFVSDVSFFSLKPPLKNVINYIYKLSSSAYKYQIRLQTDLFVHESPLSLKALK